MPYLVYKIANTVNDGIYVGTTTTTLERRWRSHCESARVHTRGEYSRPLYVAMREYGTDKFSIELIEECPDERSMLNHETLWIRRLRSVYPQGYNLHMHLTDQEAAIIKYNAFGWTAGQYAAFYGISKALVAQIRSTKIYSGYKYVTREHLLLGTQKLRQIGKALQEHAA